MTIEEKQHTINRWLRHHTDHQVTIRLYSIFGCIEVEVMQKDERLLFSIGDTLEKRLDEVIAFLKIKVS